MKASSLLLTAPYRLAWEEQDLPDPQGNQVLVRTRAGAVSIGTELALYRGVSRAASLPLYPLMTGYESVGVVADVGPDANQFKRGDRVVAAYGHRTAAMVPQDRLIPVPPGITDALALLAILACDCAKGVLKAEVIPGERVLITGGGAIGALTLFNLKARGVMQVDVVEPQGARHRLLRDLGAATVLAPEDIPENRQPYAVGFECSSCDAAFGLLQRRMGPEGRVCVLADGNLEPLTLTPEFHTRELRVVGSSDGLDYREYGRWFFAQVRGERPALEWLFQCRTAHRDLADTFGALDSGEILPVKVLVDYAGT